MASKLAKTAGLQQQLDVVGVTETLARCWDVVVGVGTRGNDAEDV